MARAIVMPSMGMYTEEGVLTAWLRPAGTQVAMGDPVAEITTEKATFEIPAPEEGILHPVATIGTSLRVEALMGYILRNGESAPANSADGAGVVQTSGAPPETSSGPKSDSPATGPLRASPLAKKLATQHGINLQEVKGTGPGGRIVEADILALVSKPSGAGQAPAPATNKPVAERLPLAGLRGSLADRLRTTLSTAASTTLTREVNADILVAARRELSEKLGQASYDSLFIKLFAAALRERPELNATIENDCILRFKEINVGFAVAAPSGLIVPVVRNADSASFREIVSAMKDLTERTLSSRLQPSHLEGGTATISNLGVHGIDAFTPILNGAQAAILGIGRIAERPIARSGQLTVGHTCVLSLTFDHRVADGAPAALLLDAVARRMTDKSFFDSLA